MTRLKLLVITSLISAVIISKIYYGLIKEDEVPRVIEQNWGTKKNNNDIRKFKIDISNEILSDLKNHLLNDRLPRGLPGKNNEFGINGKTLQDFKNYWLNTYNWRKREVYLNKYPQYITTILGLEIHFVHIKPNSGKTRVPLLIAHGWPGSFSEYYRMIPSLLDNEKDFTFDIIIPSMPGYFVSDAPDKPNWTPYDCGMILHKLMQRLGYQKYYLYGNDWGTIVVRSMALLYPNNVLGVYSPLCGSIRKISIIKQIFENFIPDWIMPRKTKRTIDQLQVVIKNSGYFHFQATFPDILGLSMTQSPLGFMSHFLTLMIMGNNATYIQSEATGLEVFEQDVLLDQIMLYWTTNSIASSMRVYKYYIKDLLHTEASIVVPFSCPIIINEIITFSDWTLSDSIKNIVQRTYFNNTGHFFTLEKDASLQNSLSKDFAEFVSKTMK